MILDKTRNWCYNIIKVKEGGEIMKRMLTACIIALVGAAVMTGCSPTGADEDCCSGESTSDCCKVENEKDCCKDKGSSENEEKKDCCKDKDNSDNNSVEDISDVPDCCAGD